MSSSELQEANNKTYPEGHFVGMWIGLGIAIVSAIWFPVSIGLKMPGLIGVGPALGVSVGVAIGSSIENKYKQKGRIRPLNASEKAYQKKALFLLLGLMVLALLILVGIFVMR